MGKMSRSTSVHGVSHLVGVGEKEGNCVPQKQQVALAFTNKAFRRLGPMAGTVHLLTERPQQGEWEEVL